MTSRERVLAAINHQIPDKIPLDIGSTAASGISAFSYYHVRRHLGLSTDGIKIADVNGMLAQMDLDLADALGIDVLLVPALAPRFGIPIDRYKTWTGWQELQFLVPEEFETERSPDGSLYLVRAGKRIGVMPEGGFNFFDLSNATMGDIASLEEPPDPDSVTFLGDLPDADLRFRESLARHLYESTDKALVADTTANIRWQTSIPNWLYAMAADPEKTKALHEKKTRALLRQIQQIHEATGQYTCVFAIYQDWGTQKGTLVSPEMFANLVAPCYKTIFSWIHEHTHWKVLFHSCGSIRPLLPLMIEMGVDIINPVQCDAADMDPATLKNEFGDRLVFWGGGVDTQTILSSGRPEDVAGQVRDRIAILGRKGGFVFAPTQDIQGNVPIENLMAVFQAFKTYR